MEKLILAGIGIALTNHVAVAACPAVKFPNYFEANEKLFSIGTDVELADSKEKSIGVIEERVMNFTPTFELMTEKGEKVAKAKERFLSWGTTIDVTDCDDKKIATIKENVWESLFSFTTQYEILDPAGALIANSAKVQFFSTNFEIKDRNGVVAFKMHRPTFNWFTDKWEVTVVKPGLVDARVVTMIPAFKTSADNRRRAAESKD